MFNMEMNQRNDEIMLSVYIATYGQEKYISRAIESVLMQKTRYSFEILVGEDASPDNTRKIMRQYERDYPGRFQMLYQDVNTYMTPNNIFVQLRRKCRGKYIIGLEGDDYWTDEYKIEKQLSFLRSHPEYLAVAHKCMVVDANSDPIEESYPECTDDEYTIIHFFSNILPGQFTTVMHINPIYHPDIDWSLWGSGLVPGDRLLYYTLALNGKIHCIQQVMSAYRHVTDSGNSYSATCRFNFSEYNQWTRAVVQYTYKHGSPKIIEYSEVYYLNFLLNCFAGHYIKFREIWRNMYHSSGVIKLLKDMMIKTIRIRIFHYKLFFKLPKR